MDSKKYIGTDVHKESISIAVMKASGKIGMECVIEIKASMILQFFDGLRGDLQVRFEEGTSAAWLHDLLKPHVTKLVVCDPRKNASMREGHQSDKIDARRLAELLRLNHLHPVGSVAAKIALEFKAKEEVVFIRGHIAYDRLVRAPRHTRDGR